MKTELINIRHPDFTNQVTNFNCWRKVLESGDSFIDAYLKRFPARETYHEYQLRKEITYVPAFALSALNEIKNAIFARGQDITREGEPSSFIDACAGDNGGVDNKNQSMTAFLADSVVLELLGMSRVCIYVDAPEIEAKTKANEPDFKPYLYTYTAENILSWSYDTNQKLKAILLRESVLVEDDVTLLGSSVRTNYRYLVKTEKGVMVQIYNSQGEIKKETTLDLEEIPCTIISIKDSLLKDVAKHQIALLQLASSDVNYCVTGNFPFYTEQFNMGIMPNMIKNPNDVNEEDETATETPKKQNPDLGVNLGVGRGRRYPKGLERPDFIHPPSEPLLASMDKQKSLRNEIRQLIQLALVNLGENQASAESRDNENRGLESGLYYIGTKLQAAEISLARIWSGYESKEAKTTIIYPKKYTIESQETIAAEIKDLISLGKINPSLKARKEIVKRITDLLLRHTLKPKILDEIKEEISQATFMTIDLENLIEDVENGIVAAEDASSIRGYPKGTVETAQKEHAARLARIQEAQTKENPAARGLNDLGGSPNLEKDNVRDTDPDNKDTTRGEE